MKKYIFTLLGLPILIGLTNAGSINISCIGENNECTPTSFSIPESENITATINNCPYGETANFSAFFHSGGSSDRGLYVDGTCEDPSIYRIGSKPGTYNFQDFVVEDPICEMTCEEYEEDTDEQEQCYQTCNEGTDGTLTFTINYTENNQDQGGTSGGGTEGGIVSGGINAFSGIIERLGSIVGEFLPYIIYIAIFCLGISLLFKAVKGLLGFTNNKAKNSIGGRAGMKDRRTRRRRNRRFQRAIYSDNRRKGGETYGQYYNRRYKLFTKKYGNNRDKWDNFRPN